MKSEAVYLVAAAVACAGYTLLAGVMLAALMGY